MSVRSDLAIARPGDFASFPEKRQRSTRVACGEKSAKLTAAPSHVAPNAYDLPRQTFTTSLQYACNPRCSRYLHADSCKLGARRNGRGEYHDGLRLRNPAR